MGMVTLDANEAVASVAYRTNEVIVLYPITPSSPMGQSCVDVVCAACAGTSGIPFPDVTEMQSEGGAIGAVHGALQSGSLATTFTASQGLLLMIPTMYKIAGELTSFAMHVAARTLATHGRCQFLAIIPMCMACRQTGFALLLHQHRCRKPTTSPPFPSPQHSSAECRFFDFFDGFRTSHEVAKIEILSDDDLLAFVL